MTILRRSNSSPFSKLPKITKYLALEGKTEPLLPSTLGSLLLEILSLLKLEIEFLPTAFS